MYRRSPAPKKAPASRIAISSALIEASQQRPADGSSQIGIQQPHPHPLIGDDPSSPRPNPLLSISGTRLHVGTSHRTNKHTNKHAAREPIAVAAAILAHAIIHFCSPGPPE
ncbi:hypothetical protein CC80DRAFT_492261 [Byssothecium circinans]|uniref:Uncharacterized protein n=1 Tax=Byssothecium circinans TaxID=147558 RepID=A0A6A5TXG1_9PLEO|nr:hypothetical protein CC80DRAFT_492261 [Byssothecium circinans]